MFFNRSSLPLLMLICCIYSALQCVDARPYRDSPIKTIIVPYYRNSVGYPRQFTKAIGVARHVLVPESMDMVPNFNLNRGSMAMGSKKGTAVNFVEGAYPVYYMPGNVNGRFNGKITLLEPY